MLVLRRIAQRAGLAGPRIAVFGNGYDGASVHLADNPETWLAFTDLVFIDPVGTGWSRPARMSSRNRSTMKATVAPCAGGTGARGPVIALCRIAAFDTALVSQYCPTIVLHPFAAGGKRGVCDVGRARC